MVLPFLDPVSIQVLYKIHYLIGFGEVSFKSGKDQQYDIAGSRGKMKCHVTEISATTLCEAISLFFSSVIRFYKYPTVYRYVLISPSTSAG